MDSCNADITEPSVDDGAFWHTNMDLYYGYIPGEVVEVEHESSKYWLATIEYSFKHLVLLRWLGNYGEFWIDTSSMTNVASCSSGSSNEHNYLKRLFPLGYHLQSQIKSQFTLAKPTKILIKPSLYEPSKDPYSKIQTVDDLLSYEAEKQENETFAQESAAGIVLAKCNYGQEDVDELEAALQSLTDLDYDGSKLSESPNNIQRSLSDTFQSSANNQIDAIEDKKSTTFNPEASISIPMTIDESSNIKSEDLMGETTTQMKIEKGQEQTDEDNSKMDERQMKLCRQLQDSAISKGRYLGVQAAGDEQTNQVFFLKPRQFFDVGGANHERLFVPGTILEVCHSYENEQKNLDIANWFAYVVKNTGGRLTLKWFICDEPKFKQGRLEMKSCHSKLDTEPDAVSDISDGHDTKGLKSLTFSMHFCNPKIQTVSYAKTINRAYKLPETIIRNLLDVAGQEYVWNVEKTHLDYIFDSRRMNLDKDRPLIDHILNAVRNKSPNYLDLIFSPKDKTSQRKVLISCPKMTKLLRATVKREIEPNVFEVHSDPLPETGEVIKFIYPLDSCYAILPLDWAVNNEDCLSVHPSRTTSPQVPEIDQTKPEHTVEDEELGGLQAKKLESDTCNTSTSNSEPIKCSNVNDMSCDILDSTTNSTEHCLKSARLEFPRAGGSFMKLTNIDSSHVPEIKELEEFDELDPSSWSRILRSRELDAPNFHCCIEYSQKDFIESRFKVMDQLEIVHPSSDSIICLGRIRKVVFPLLWIQLSPDCFTLVPFNLTDIYPTKWCETYEHKIISLLPPRKRFIEAPAQQSDSKRRKTARNQSDNVTASRKDRSHRNYGQVYEKEHFDLCSLNDRQANIDYILNEKSAYVQIYFNHKCFTGPSLSKSKICSLPQYVGPGPMRLVIEEVVTKVISVAYVPPRILNDLSSKSFEELLIERNLTNTAPMEFKAKYQKRVHRDEIQVCLNPDDVALYCECICEHIKCCYNLFGLHLYDGDDCPSHCRSLTKSNKYMKRATYYREKARQGDFLPNDASGTSNGGSSGKKQTSNNSKNNVSSRTNRAKYSGRGSSESTASSVISRSDQVHSRASSSSSASEDGTNCELKENLDAVAEEKEEVDLSNFKTNGYQDLMMCVQLEGRENVCEDDNNCKDDRTATCTNDNLDSVELKDTYLDEPHCFEDNLRRKIEFLILPGFNLVEERMKDSNLEEWTPDDVAQILDMCNLSTFKSIVISESIDGQALLLLDKQTIEEHFQLKLKDDSALEETNKFHRFIELIKTRVN